MKDWETRISNSELRDILDEFSSFLYYRDYFKDYIILEDITEILNNFIKGEG